MRYGYNDLKPAKVPTYKLFHFSFAPPCAVRALSPHHHNLMTHNTKHYTSITRGNTNVSLTELRHCRSANKHGLVYPTYNQYLVSEHWRNTKTEFYNSVLFKGYCEGCKLSYPNYHSHHITYEKLGEEPLNHLVALCPYCHNTIHSFIRANKDVDLITAMDIVNFDTNADLSLSDISTIQELYNTRFKYWNDHLVYSALLSLALQNFTLSPSVTNTELRRMTGIVGHNSVVVSLERLINIGLIRKELLKSSKNDAGYFQIYKYYISPKIDPEQKLRHVKQVFNTVTEELNAQKVIGKSYSFIPLLLEVGKLTPKEISERFDIGYSITRDYIKKLFDLGLLQREKSGRKTIYSMSENYYEILHELMVTHLVKNTTKINAEISRYELLKSQRKIFNEVKDEYVKDGTLETKLRELGNEAFRNA